MATAVLDIGKTNVKVALFDGEGRRLAETSLPNASLPGPPYRHYDTGMIWRFLLSALAELARTHAIETIVPTTHGATVAFVTDDPDVDEGLALPIMDYEDPVVEAIEPDYARLRPPFAETFSPPLGNGLNYGRQIAWMRKHHPDRMAAARAMLPYPQYWSWRLSGVMSAEPTSLGCHSDLWEPAHGRLSRLATALDVHRLMPPVVHAFDRIGAIRPEIAARTGLSPTTRILSGIHDSNASLLPHLLTRQAPFTVISTGTWVVMMGVGAPLERLDQRASMLANVAADGRPVACAIFMGGREFDVLTKGHPAVATLADVEAVIGAGALALPCFSGEGGPFAQHAGRIEGTLPACEGARAALATLYSVLMTDHMLTRLGADAGALVVEGGFVKSPLYAGLLAALRPQQPMLIADNTAGTAQGAALLATWPKPPVDLSRPVSPLVPKGLDSYVRRWRDRVHHL
ncbi:FGGY-family carbohydrate kinase [Bradyrhizobium sp. HKCCYLS2038]|uniref:FGGY-family carbohydrate kinase n=1 Tax=unclassified Bradyrhizobium TaxID=2631580 RepID=UPI003EBE7F57